jgi:hypothetical protein
MWVRRPAGRPWISRSNRSWRRRAGPRAGGRRRSDSSMPELRSGLLGRGHHIRMCAPHCPGASPPDACRATHEAMLHPSLIERITRSLAYMLRHQPEQFDLEVDEYGFADLDDVVAALNERLGEPVEADDVVPAVEGGRPPEVRDPRGRDPRALRALDPSEAGRAHEAAGRPLRRHLEGRRGPRPHVRAAPGRRSFLHLALTPEDALETGRRDFARLRSGQGERGRRVGRGDQLLRPEVALPLRSDPDALPRRRGRAHGRLRRRGDRRPRRPRPPAGRPSR